MSKSTKWSYRIEIVPDESPYDMGDGVTPEREEEINDIIARDGVWGFCTQRLNNEIEGADWEDMDSCFGFLGNDTAYMLDTACECLPRHMDGKWIEVVEEGGAECSPHKVRLGAASMLVHKVGTVVSMPDSKLPQARYRVVAVSEKGYALQSLTLPANVKKVSRSDNRFLTHRKARE